MQRSRQERRANDRPERDSSPCEIVQSGYPALTREIEVRTNAYNLLTHAYNRKAEVWTNPMTGVGQSVG